MKLWYFGKFEIASVFTVLSKMINTSGGDGLKKTLKVNLPFIAEPRLHMYKNRVQFVTNCYVQWRFCDAVGLIVL